ncbi:mitochondrial inner membrane protease ATP23 homolog [Palaemon carinicauda]|uniref:mitochondrial inner membrane protease ATP23 homolog n=1 Tax=Palaemon carinicauda TaxID=392227 RepID=UPI0035B69820
MNASAEEKPSEEHVTEKTPMKAEAGETSPEEKWGYDLYPERRGEKYKPSLARIAWLGEGRENIDKIKCERNVWSCVQKSPAVKLMLSALKSSGCEVDLTRHISCEVCDVSVSGGYDPELNQVVICQNVARSEGLTQGVLTHELIHMFDYCKHKLDFKNLDHLACTEIRAANLTHCSFMSAMFQGDASPFRIAKTHQDCVRRKAAMSVMAVRRVTEAEALNVVDKVFDRCYNDLEPIGRRIRRNSHDMHKAYMERFSYGYD